MPWVAPKTDFVNGDVLTATQMNNIGNDLAMLNGGTTGQVLAKTSNADGAFAWTSETDPNAIPKTLIDAKGDLIAGSAADTAARLAVGTNGQVLTADSTTATGLKWATASGGGITLISTATPSAATTVSFTSIPTTYKQLLVVWVNVYTNTLGNYWGVRLNNDSGSNYYGAGVGSISPSANYDRYSGQTLFGVNGGTCPIGYSPTSSGSNFRNAGFFRIWNADATNDHKVVHYGGLNANDLGDNFASGANNFHGRYASLSAISRLDFIRSGSENITGTFYLYGLS